MADIDSVFATPSRVDWPFFKRSSTTWFGEVPYAGYQDDRLRVADKPGCDDLCTLTTTGGCKSCGVSARFSGRDRKLLPRRVAALTYSSRVRGEKKLPR